jgi:hypothetical protein
VTEQTSVREELKASRWWFALLALAVVAGFVGIFVGWRDEVLHASRLWIRRHRAAFWVLLAGGAAAQFVVAMIRSVAAGISKLDKIGGAENRWPQQLLGLAETIGYSVALAKASPKEVITAAGAWIAFKQFGNWPRWVATDKGGEGQSSTNADEKRRRFYVFLLANVSQIGLAAAVGRSLVWALKQ